MTLDWMFCYFCIIVGTITAVCMFFGVRDNFMEELQLRFDERIKELEK